MAQLGADLRFCPRYGAQSSFDPFWQKIVHTPIEGHLEVKYIF